MSDYIQKTIKFKPAELMLINKLADAEGKTFSQVVRESISVNIEAKLNSYLQLKDIFGDLKDISDVFQNVGELFEDE